MSRREFSLPIADFDPAVYLKGSRSEFAVSPTQFLEKLVDKRRTIRWPDRRDAQDYWKGVPWITPIVGSGPLGLPQQFLECAPAIPAAVREAVDHVEIFGESFGLQGVGQDEQDWAPEFVTRLIEERTGLRPDRGRVAADIQIGDLALHYLLLSAQLTRLFHRISLDTSRPISRWGSARAAQDKQPHNPRTDETKREYVEILTSLVTKCSSLLDEPRSVRFPRSQLERLLSMVQQNANAGEVELLHVEQITEIAWNLLIEDVSDSASYPGWTDLLLQLVFDTEQAVDNAYRRPRIEQLEKIAKHIREMHGQALDHYWSDKQGKSLDSRAFYDALADVLWAQDVARRTEPLKGRTLPCASSFVVSFDSELEWALIRRALPQSRSFVVLVPMYLCREFDTDGDFVWLEAHIDVIASRQSINGASPTVIQWRAIVPGRSAIDRKPDAPVVVRLVGAPWLVPPELGIMSTNGKIPNPELDKLLRQDLQSLFKHLGGSARIESYKLVPAITISEYHALLLSRDEWTSEGSDGHQGRGLPQNILQDGGGPVRYWAVLGVPFRDPAVRARVLSLLARPFGRSEVSSRRSGTVESTGKDGAAPESTAPVATSAEPTVSTSVSSLPGIPGIPALIIDPPAEDVTETVATSTEANDDLSSDVPRPNEAPPRDASDVTAGVQRLRGMAVNRELEDDEVSVLLGLGLNVIRDRCEAFVPDLQHYSNWINEGAAGRG